MALVHSLTELRTADYEFRQDNKALAAENAIAAEGRDAQLLLAAEQNEQLLNALLAKD